MHKVIIIIIITPKKSSFRQIKDTKNAIFFLSRATIHRSFLFNLRFLHELKCKICLSKSVSGIFHFRIRLAFIKVYVFVKQKAWTLWR